MAFGRHADSQEIKTEPVPAGIEIISEKRQKHRAYIGSLRWEILRQAVFQRRGRMCECCLRPDATLDLHHLFYPENIENTEEKHLMILCRPCHDNLHKNFPNKAYVYQESEIADLKWWIRSNHNAVTRGRTIEYEPSKRITYPNSNEKRRKKKKNRHRVNVRSVLAYMTETQKKRIISECNLSGDIELRSRLYALDKFVCKSTQRICGCGRISDPGLQKNQPKCKQKFKVDWHRQKWGIR